MEKVLWLIEHVKVVCEVSCTIDASAKTFFTVGLSYALEDV